MRTQENYWQLKGIVQRKLRWVKIALYRLAADISYFHFKGHYSFKSIQPVSVFNDHKNYFCRINVASAANSLYRCANFYNLIYTGKLISGTATYQFSASQHQLHLVFTVHYGFVRDANIRM
jgi:hypothetical protein